jgi:hypothetical protein
VNTGEWRIANGEVSHSLFAILGDVGQGGGIRATSLLSARLLFAECFDPGGRRVMARIFMLFLFQVAAWVSSE